MADVMMLPGAQTQARKIKLLIMDVDGVLSDGGIFISAEGEAFKRFDIKDGLGISLWHRMGFKTAIITGRSSAIVEKRAAELGISEVRQGQSNKRIAYAELKRELGLTDEEIAYIGDDLIDLPVLQQAGLAVAVADAAPEAKLMSHYVTAHNGGHGAVRETVEFMLRAKKLWDDAVASYFA